MKTKCILVVAFILSLNLHAQKEFEVSISGNGQPVLLFPGFTCTGEEYQDLVGELSENHTVYNFTFAGFGNVPPIEKPWLPKIKVALENYISKNNLKKPIIIGHSMGGTLGLWLAADDPELFSKLIIIDALPAMGALMIPDYDSKNIVYDTPYNQRILEMKDSDFKQMAKQMTATMTQNTAKQQQLTDWMINSDRETYVYGYTDLLKLDLRPELSKIKIPVIILAATEPYGQDIAEKNYRKQYQSLDDYSLYFAEGSSHFIMYDKPEWFLSQIKSALKE
ncbi:MAG: alpha/beta fold hydrolase [Aequorivita sp.]